MGVLGCVMCDRSQCAYILIYTSHKQHIYKQYKRTYLVVVIRGPGLGEDGLAPDHAPVRDAARVEHHVVVLQQGLGVLQADVLRKMVRLGVRGGVCGLVLGVG